MTNFIIPAHKTIYCMLPYYHTVRLGFTKLLKKRNTYLIRAHFKESSAEDLLNYAQAICLLMSFIQSYVVGTQLNCIDLSR